jgi:hypothetical protein
VESKGFLGGKYVEPVQVIAGEVQTFTARQAATGRPVYVHQVVGAGRQEQTKLLKLLLMCLYRVPAVKERVLDISDEGDNYYVVTESSPPFLMLREWLEREWQKAEGSPKQTAPEPGAASDKRFEQPFRQEGLRDEVQRPTPPKQTFDRPVPASGIPQPPPSAPKTSDDQGEFTRLFQQAGSQRPPAGMPSDQVQRPAPSAPKPATPDAELSRKSALPNGSANPPAHRDAAAETQLFSPASRNVKPADQHSVQSSPMRPVTPVPPSPASGAPPNKGPKPGVDERGEHTRLFATPAASGADPKRNASAPAAPDSLLAGSPNSPKTPEGSRSAPGELTQLFSAGPTVPQEKPAASPDQKPLAGHKDEPGEFTRFFSAENPASNRSSTPLPTPGVQRPSAPPLVPPRTSGTPPQGAPGEFTQLFSGAPFSGAPREEGRPVSAPPSNFKNTSVPGDPFRNPQSQGRSGTAGEFTRMFGVVSDTPQPSSSIGSAGPGEYTKLFGIPDSAPMTPQSQKTPGAPSSLPSLNEPGPGAGSRGPGKGTGPGEFTQVIGQPSTGPVAGGPSRNPATPAPAGGGGSPMPPLNFKPQVPPVPHVNMPHASVAPPSVTPVSAAPPHAPAVSAPHLSAQVGGVGVSASPQMPAPAPIPQPAMPASAASKPRVALVVVFAVLLMLAIALVVLIAMQR